MDKSKPVKKHFHSARHLDSLRKEPPSTEKTLLAKGGLDLSTIHQAKRSFLTPASNLDEELKTPTDELQNIEMFLSPTDLSFSHS